MAATHQEHKPKLTARIASQRLWGERPFFLLDVGASGGVERRWFVFRELLRAIGFDPLVAEVERLNQANTHPGVRYEAALVGVDGYDELFPPALRGDRLTSKNNCAFERSSAAAAQRQLSARTGQTYIQTVFNAGAAVVWTDRLVTLDSFVPSAEQPFVDFIKIDTDGHDVEVLLGAERLLRSGGALGVSVELQHHGAVHEYANTFSNIDRLLRRHGFTMFDLQLFRYSRATLPGQFAVRLGAHTVSGPVLSSEGLYFRDLADSGYEQMWSYDISRERVLKLVCLFEIFGLRDCAAELLVNRVADSHVDELLDLLVDGNPGSYHARLKEFERDFTSFYPPDVADERPATEEPKTRALNSRIEELKAKNGALTQRLQQQDTQIKSLKRLIKDVKRRPKQA